MLSKLPAARRIGGLLVYRERESSFDFHPDSPVDLADAIGSMGTTSLAMGTLQIEVGVETGRLLYAWGLLPRNLWSSKRLPLPSKRDGGLTLMNHDLEAGISEKVAESDKCLTLHDRDSGWIRHSTSEEIDEDTFVEVADGVVIGLLNGGLVSVWLAPSFD